MKSSASAYGKGIALWGAGVSLAGCMLAAPVRADEPMLPQSWSELAPPFADIDYNFRIDVLSDLIERGITRTRHKPTARAVANVEWGILYLSASAYRIDTGPLRVGDELEAELALGVSDRRGPFFYDLSFAEGFARSVFDQYSEFNLRLSYDLTTRFTAIAFAGYAPDEYGQEILWGGGGGRFNFTDDLSAFADIGDAHYPDGIIPDYQYWRVGLDYTLNDWTSVGIAYHATTLNARDCALVAESLIGNSCDAGVMGRVSFWFDRTDVQSAFGAVAGSGSPGSDANPPSLETLSAKMSHSRVSNDEDPW